MNTYKVIIQFRDRKELELDLPNTICEGDDLIIDGQRYMVKKKTWVINVGKLNSVILELM